MTDYKQLCAEMVDAWDALPWQYDYKGRLTGLDGYPPDDSAVERARAALAEPKPEAPTDAELLGALKAGIAAFPPRHPEALNLSAAEYEVDLEIRKARAVLARWGNHQQSPDSSTPQPVPVSERLPGLEDCDAEGKCWAWQLDDEEAAWHLEFQEWIDSPWTTHWLPAHALPQPF